MAAVRRGPILPAGVTRMRTRERVEEIWRSERAYFDAQAEAALARAHRGVAPEVIARYRAAAHPWHGKEFRFRLLGDLRGKRVLDVGCGMGENAVLLAACGARVTGVDVSERSIACARRLAAGSGVEVELLCAPLEDADLPPRSFDVVWGDGVLHHVLHDLDGVLARLTSLAREGARVVFSEPVDRVPGLRLVRALLPIPLDGTPNERPLREAELDVVRRHLPGLTVRPFVFLSRVNRFLVHNRLEDAPPLRRQAAEALARLDAALLAVPGVSRLGAMCVLYGTVGAPGPLRPAREQGGARPGQVVRAPPTAR